MELYKNKYRVESIRLKNWDYSNNGYYFITICTKEKEHFFGNIIDGKMFLNDIGKIIYDEWYKSEKMRPNIILDEFIIMPNHIHGIIIINNDNVETHSNASLPNHNANQKINDVSGNNSNNNILTDNDNVNETHSNASLPNNNTTKKNNLSNIIRGFKSSSTKLIHISGFNNFAWQPRFYEHIIRNDNSLQNIRQYIINNPVNWSKDKNNIK
jgi:putative transposase